MSIFVQNCFEDQLSYSLQQFPSTVFNNDADSIKNYRCILNINNAVQANGMGNTSGYTPYNWDQNYLKHIDKAKFLRFCIPFPRTNSGLEVGVNLCGGTTRRSNGNFIATREIVIPLYGSDRVVEKIISSTYYAYINIDKMQIKLLLGASWSWRPNDDNYFNSSFTVSNVFMYVVF